MLFSPGAVLYRDAFLAALLGKHRPRWTLRGRRCRCGRPLATWSGRTRLPYCSAFLPALTNRVTTDRQATADVDATAPSVVPDRHAIRRRFPV